MKVPIAIAELLGRFFGRGDRPNYSGTLALIERDPYAEVREALAGRWRLTEYTDYNSDLSFNYSIEFSATGAEVRLSMVGPYAVVLSTTGEVTDIPEIAEVLVKAGFHLLDQPMLSRPVSLWGPEYELPLYEYLFEFDMDLPWERGIGSPDESNPTPGE